MPLTVIRASAGSGKTFQLALSFIRILLAGELAGQPRNPAAILATTFTRAAAGEILDRVLRLVAEAVLAEERREFLAKELGLPLSAEHAARLLGALAAQVDRLAISTMDAFFGQIAKALSSGLGFAPEWSMAVNEAEAELLRRTLHALLGATDPRSLGAALWTFRRGVVNSMLDALAQLAPEFAAGTHEDELADDFAEPAPRRWSAAEIAEAARVLADRARWIPRNKSNQKPPSTWEAALDKIAAELRADAATIPLLEITLAARIFFGGDFQKHAIPPEFRDAMLPLVALASAARRDQHLARGTALRWLGAHYARHRRGANFAGGTYTFGDVAAMVAAAAFGSSDLFFRIGTRFEHVLFDEFQDTSRLQFRFFQPIVEEIGSTGGEVLIVGDEKQAIYGWRGSDRALMQEPLRALGARIGASGEKTLEQSFRSSPAVLGAVNRTFLHLRTAWLAADAKDKAVLEEAGRAWAENFPAHRPAAVVADLQGRVRLLKVAKPPDGNAESLKLALVAKAVELVGAHLAEDRDRKIAVLLRKNALMPQLIANLRAAHPEVDVSGEGGNPLTDSRAVEMVLAVLAWLEHPGSTAEHHLITHSPLAGVFGFSSESGPAEEEVLARNWRRQIMERGVAAVLHRWIREADFAAACSDHDGQRCEQLLAVAREFDALPPGRLAEFVAHVRARRVERPGSSGVRVMTIHAAKGLEFEAVIVLDLDAAGGGFGTAILRDPDGAFHIVPAQDQAPLMGLEELVRRSIREDFMEELSVLYVAMTRSRSFLDIVLRESGKMPVAALLRAALSPIGEDGIAEECAGLSFAASQRARETPAAPAEKDPGLAATQPWPPAAIAADFARTIFLAPSQAGARETVSVARIFAPANRAARRRGELIHEWLRQIAWIEDGLPAAEQWIDAAIQSGRDVLDRRDIARWARALLAEARAAGTELHRALSCPAAGEGETIECWRERRFAVVRASGGRNEVLSGSLDRVVLWRDAQGRALRAGIVDFKTDRFDSPAERAEIEHRYAPQLAAYRAALGLLCPELGERSIRAALVFVAAV